MQAITASTSAGHSGPDLASGLPVARDSARQDPELGRELILCHRRKPSLVFPISGLVLGGMVVLLMLGLATDSGSATANDFVVLSVLVAIFAGSGGLLLWYRRRVIALRQVLRVCERGVVRDDINGRRVLVRFADVSKVEDSTIVTPLTSTYIVALKGASRWRTVISSQRYDNVDARLTETLRALAPAMGRN